MIEALDRTAESMDRTLREASSSLQQTLDNSRTHLVAFHQTVEKFNGGVHDFSEVDYDLRGTVERLDVAVRDLVTAFRQTGRSADRGDGR